MSNVDAVVGMKNRAGAERRRAWLDGVLLVLLLAVLFGYELGSRALWHPDEGRYAEIPREMVASGDYLTPRLNGVKYFEKPVLFYWLQAGAIRIFGLHEWSLRLWTALFAGLGCVAVFYAANRLYGRRAGWFAATVLATTPLYDFMGGAITLDMAVTALLTAALLAFLVGVREPPGTSRRLCLYGFYVLAAAATLTKGLIGIVIPGMVILAWIALLGRWSLLRQLYLPSGLLLFVSIVAPWHVLVARANPEFAHFYFVHEHFERYFTTVHQRYAPMWYFIPVLLAGMYPWSAFFFQAIKDALSSGWAERRQDADSWFLVLWAGLVFVFFSLSDSKLAPYILPVMPPLALLCGRYFARVWEQPALFGRRRLFWALLVLGVVLSLVLLSARYFLPEHPRVALISGLLGPNLYLIAASLMLAGILPFVLSQRGYTRRTIVSLLVTSALLVTMVDLSLAKVDVNRSVKPLALAIKQRIQPGDEVASFREYYQDLPVYLERRITVVEWKGELEFGTTVEDTGAWMIGEPQFASRLQHGVVYIVTRLDNVEKLRRVAPVPLHELTRYGVSVLLTNQELPR